MSARRVENAMSFCILINIRGLERTKWCAARQDLKVMSAKGGPARKGKEKKKRVKRVTQDVDKGRRMSSYDTR